MDTLQATPIKPLNPRRKTNKTYIGSEPRNLIFRPHYIHDLKDKNIEYILYKIRCIIIDSYEPDVQINVKEFIGKSMTPDHNRDQCIMQRNCHTRLYYYDILITGLGLDTISAQDLYNQINVVRLHYDRTAFMHDYEIENCKGYTVNGKEVL